MTAGIVDTNVIIDILKRNPPAIQWLMGQREQLAITPITWLEVMYGLDRKSQQSATLKLLNQFEMLDVTPQDIHWAMDRLRLLRPSFAIEIMDYLMASVCQRMTIPLITHNLKHMRPLLGDYLVIKPYEYK